MDDDPTQIVMYLMECQDIINFNQEFPLVKVVLGNSSCDLDSAACSLCYAFSLYLEDRLKHMENPLNYHNGEYSIIPVFNINRDELQYKTEVLHVLRKLNIPEELIIFRNEINLEELANQGKLQLVLVDHHVLSDTDTVLEKSVVEILDHRPVIKQWDLAPDLCTILPVGSCCTLVAQKMISKNGIIYHDSQIAKLLYYGILIDTMNFNEKSQRFTEEDIRVVRLIEPHALKKNQPREDIYNELLGARTNVDTFTGPEILTKDMKLAKGVPVCTLPYLAQDFSKRQDAEKALSQMLVSRSCSLIILIGISIKEDLMQRDIGFYSTSNVDLYHKVLTALQTDTSLNLSLDEIPDTGIKLLKIFKQQNFEKTRKHMLPIILDVVTQWTKETNQ